MSRLPLEYAELFKCWLPLQDIIRRGENVLPLGLTQKPWQEKLKMLISVASTHPDTGLCSKCGLCCLEFPFNCRPMEFLHIIYHIARHWDLAKQRDFFLKRLGLLKKDGSVCCPFWEPQGCLIYEARPLICRRSVCGPHLCNNIALKFENQGHRQSNEDVMRQLSIMSMIYYHYEDGRWLEMGWPVLLDFGLKTRCSSLISAPFEIWLLLLLNKPDACQELLYNNCYKPVIRVNCGEPRWLGVKNIPSQ